MTRRLFQDSTMMQNTRQVAVRYVAIDAAGFQHFQVVQREKAAIGTHLSWWLATFPVHFVHHRYQQPIVVQFPADLLGHDQMIVAHRQRCGIAQSESPPIRQKAAVPIGAGKLAHPGFLQPLEPHRNVAQLCGKLLHGRARHLQPGPFIGIFAGALLLPAPNVLADLGAFRAQLLEAIGGAGRCAGRDARGINGYVPQLSQSQRARQLHHLGEDVVQRSPMPLAKLIQRPKIRLRPSRQIAKRQIFPNALLQPPRAGHPQCVGIQPHFQQQRRVIRWMSLIAIASFQFPQVQLLHRAMHEKTQMNFSQHRSHRWWQQISLLRVVLQKIGHPALLLSRQYTSSVKLSCHTDSYPLPSLQTSPLLELPSQNGTPPERAVSTLRSSTSSASFTSSPSRLRLFHRLPRIPTVMNFLRPNIGSQLPASGRFCLSLSTRHSPLATSALCFSTTFMTDDAKALARGLQRRDPELLDRLIEQYQFRLFRYLLHLTANRERAEDFFQETWLRVLERGHQYDGKWKFEAWLFAIARNLVLDWHRRKKPQSLESLAGPDEDAAPFDVKDEKSASPLEQVLQAEAQSGVELSLQRVPAVYREVLVLRFQEEMQLDEIAGVTGAPISTVKSRLYRGLEALKQSMQGGAA